MNFTTTEFIYFTPAASPEATEDAKDHALYGPSNSSVIKSRPFDQNTRIVCKRGSSFIQALSKLTLRMISITCRPICYFEERRLRKKEEMIGYYQDLSHHMWLL
ncbi:MAG: hypothetical protein JRJ02_04665 [Deltaproteobacteria bacterium]|nr:hypothetical protein [Deltaproteobacteria bacterium]